MKNLSKSLLLFGLMAVMVLSSCSKANECDGDCVFSGQDIKAEVLYLNCFSQFGLIFPHPRDEGRTIVGVPNDMKKDFQKEGAKVTFDGGFFLNELSPNPDFPDPGIAMEDIYQVEIWKMSGRE